MFLSANRKRQTAAFGLLATAGMLLGSVGQIAQPSAAAGFADPAFQRVWERTDLPVAGHKVARTWFWGPGPNSDATQEKFEGHNRLVQYFDKSRMEINDPNGDKNGKFYVTNGLLTVELMSGKIQTGATTFEDSVPANINMTGDDGDKLAPSYAAMARVSNAGIDHRAVDRTGKFVIGTMNNVGFVANDPAKGNRPEGKIAYFENVTGHNIPQVFWDFLNQKGVVSVGGQTSTQALNDPWFYASGYPISEAYYVQATIGGKVKEVLLQAFERRVLTYVADNPEGFKVEMGNIGQHYFNWRYNNAGRAPLQANVPNVTPLSPAAGELGSASNPIKMAFVPSANTQKIIASAQPVADQLSAVTGYKFQVSVPTSYAASIEAMGSEKADIVWFAPFAYVLANQKYQAQVLMTTVRHNSTSYPSVIITSDPSVKKPADLRGKKFAFVDKASASGYLYPFAYFKALGVDPNNFFSEVVFAGGHDKVASAVYNGQVSGGAIFGGPPDPKTGKPTDARSLIASTYPDVFDKVRIIGESEEIPNDTVTARAGLTQAMRDQLTNGLIVVANSAQGRKNLYDLYQIDGLLPVQDNFYDPVRQTAAAAGLTDLGSLFPTPAPPTPKP
jgi:phosphate/phosphite/phosphonate ABC transporter binding protein